jgi:hypothetical protein
MRKRLFASKDELISTARELMRIRVKAVENDVKVCLAGKPPAPFSALLYCFATIDLLGAFSAGDARTLGRHRRARISTTRNARAFMRKFMKYNLMQTTLLQQVYRHKLVHLAQPKLVEYKGRVVAWEVDHGPAPQHLRMIGYSPPREIRVLPAIVYKVEHTFVVSIRDLVADIKKSVFGTGYYLDQLTINPRLQQNFARALRHIYDPRA